MINAALHRLKAFKALEAKKLDGINVTWTGYRNKDEEAWVKSQGGNVVPYGSKTDILLVAPEGNKQVKTGKPEKAIEKGKTVIHFKDLQKMKF